MLASKLAGMATLCSSLRWQEQSAAGWHWYGLGLQGANGEHTIAELLAYWALQQNERHFHIHGYDPKIYWEIAPQEPELAEDLSKKCTFAHSAIVGLSIASQSGLQSKWGKPVPEWLMSFAQYSAAHYNISGASTAFLYGFSGLYRLGCYKITSSVVTHEDHGPFAKIVVTFGEKKAE